jgi:hypothetical protein
MYSRTTDLFVTTHQWNDELTVSVRSWRLPQKTERHFFMTIMSNSSRVINQARLIVTGRWRFHFTKGPWTMDDACTTNVNDTVSRLGTSN